jgi:hypothetical protein
MTPKEMASEEEAGEASEEVEEAADWEVLGAKGSDLPLRSVRRSSTKISTLTGKRAASKNMVRP